MVFGRSRRGAERAEPIQPVELVPLSVPESVDLPAESLVDEGFGEWPGEESASRPGEFELNPSVLDRPDPPAGSNLAATMDSPVGVLPLGDPAESGADVETDDVGSDDLGSDDLGSDNLGSDDVGSYDLGIADAGIADAGFEHPDQAPAIQWRDPAQLSAPSPVSWTSALTDRSADLEPAVGADLEPADIEPADIEPAAVGAEVDAPVDLTDGDAEVVDLRTRVASLQESVGALLAERQLETLLDQAAQADASPPAPVTTEAVAGKVVEASSPMSVAGAVPAPAVDIDDEVAASGVERSTRTLVFAQQTADSVVLEAQRKADAIVAEAERQRSEIIRRAREQADADYVTERDRVARATAEWERTRAEILARLDDVAAGAESYREGVAQLEGLLAESTERFRSASIGSTPADSQN